MSSTARKVITPVIISFVFVLPFVILELIDRQGFQQPFPFVLFGVMWLLTLLFVLILMPMWRSFRTAGITNRFTLVPKVVMLTAIAGILLTLIVDQMPCFLGVPNCD